MWKRADEDLLPIMHPLYNLREICKQCALLEDHLNNERKRCQDCIRKHFLTIEALFEEATALDNLGKWAGLIDGKADLVRQFQTRWIDGGDPRELAQALREIRKGFSEECFDLRGMTEASRTAGTRERCSLASFVAEVHDERTTRDQPFTVFRHNLLGAFAMWAVRLSPYEFPADLEAATLKLGDYFAPMAQTLAGLDWLEFTRHGLEDHLVKAFEAIPEIAAWNNRRNGDDRPFGVASLGSEPDPDDDFVDLFALANNVANTLWREDEPYRDAPPPAFGALIPKVASRYLKGCG